MARPVLLTVDDDPEVLRAVEADLRKRYSERYRILSANSGQAALDLLEKVRKRNDPVAMLLVDHRMPGMTGIEFLSKARQQFPEARRVLLTAYADTDAAIQAINDIKLNHYLLKPWDPPDRNLYPVLDDLLEDWQAHYHPAFDGIRILGARYSPQSYELREFMARNHVPYRWMDIDAADHDPEVKATLNTLAPDEVKLPLVLFPDGSKLAEPDAAAVAQRVGLRMQTKSDFFDVVIVGAGPAGLAAGVYGASEGLKTLIVEREAPGGQAGLSSKIENYLGFPSGLGGDDLTRRAVAQARRFGVEILSPQEAVGIRAEGPYRYIKLKDGAEVSCHALIIATGVQWRTLDVPGIDRLYGAGIYYGAAPTEAISCRDEDVYIVGGANSAGQAAMNFSRYARRVVMLVRGPSLAASMSKYLIDEIEKTPNIEVACGKEIVEVFGTERLEEIAIRCSRTDTVDRVPATGLFVFIGAQPKTDWLDGFVERDAKGFVLTGQDLMHDGKPPKGWPSDRIPTLLETNVPGVFAVGDVRYGSVKRVASGVGEGSVAIQFVHQYLAKV